MEKIVFDTAHFDGVGAVKLAQTAASKEIRITMQKGAVMPSHKAPGEICVQVLRGEIDFSLDDTGEAMRLKELDLITLAPLVPHSLKALENSIIRLSLSTIDSEKRVEAVIANEGGI